MGLKFYQISETTKKVLIPLFSSRIKAGFPDPTENFIEKRVDLNEQLVKNPAATFYVKVDGNSMVEAQLRNGDVLIVDRSLNAESGNIVLAVIDGEFTVKRLLINKNGSVELVPENPDYKKIQITGEMNFRVWGVVTSIIYNALGR